MSPRTTSIAALVLLCACAEPTAPRAGLALRAPLATPRPSGAAAGAPADASCTFARGTTSCTTVVARFTETETRALVSGCVAGPTGQPGRRPRTLLDTYQVTVTTTALSRGRGGPVYDSSTDTERLLVSSVEISNVCDPL
jgi:hypothetical protein